MFRKFNETENGIGGKNRVELNRSEFYLMNSIIRSERDECNWKHGDSFVFLSFLESF